MSLYGKRDCADVNNFRILRWEIILDYLGGSVELQDPYEGGRRVRVRKGDVMTRRVQLMQLLALAEPRRRGHRQGAVSSLWKLEKAKQILIRACRRNTALGHLDFRHSDFQNCKMEKQITKV